MLAGVVNAAVYFAVCVVVVGLIIWLDDLLNSAYRLGDELRKGNVALGLATAGKAIGLCIIAFYAIQVNESLLRSTEWILIGGALQIAGTLALQMAAVRFHVGRELAAGNRAVGVMWMGVSIGLSLVVAACIS